VALRPTSAFDHHDTKEKLMNAKENPMESMHPRHVLRLDRYLLTEHSLDVRDAQSREHAIRVRVDWNGDSASLGTFEVWNLDGCWEACGNLSPESSANDLILAGPKGRTDPFRVQIERGPAHGARPFEAWAYAIAWKQDPLAQGSLPSSFSAIRHEHYEYAQPGAVCHVMSTLENGVQTVELMLDPGFDYELWIKLQHPEREDSWCIHDPIVSPGDRGGSSTPPN
jgi:hypothetical protein